MADWQPIETAPKDGTEVLIWNPRWEIAVQASWGDWDADEVVFGAWVFKNDMVMVFGACEEGVVGWNEDVQDGAMPTHWSAVPTQGEAFS